MPVSCPELFLPLNWEDREASQGRLFEGHVCSTPRSPSGGMGSQVSLGPKAACTEGRLSLVFNEPKRPGKHGLPGESRELSSELVLAGP